MAPAEARDKAGHEEQGSQPFDGKGSNEDGAHKTGQALVIPKAKTVPVVSRIDGHRFD